MRATRAGAGTCQNRRYAGRLIPFAVAAFLTAPAAAQIANFQHIVVVVQENRTPDNLFQGLCTTRTACSTSPGPGQYNIQTRGWLDKASRTGMTHPHPAPFGLGYDLGHNHASFINMCDPKDGVCAMDGAASVNCAPLSQSCPPKPQYAFVDYTTGSVQPYLELVKNFGWGNYMFQTNQGPSFPAHQFLFGGTSAPSASYDQSGIFAADNTGGGSTSNGCIAPPPATVDLINPYGVIFTRIYPCFERETLTDRLDARGISWRYYGGTPGGSWMAPNAIAHICVASGGNCTGSDWISSVDARSHKDILSDILANCNLRGVSWVIPDGSNSDHSGNVAAVGGPSWVTAIVNAVGTSACLNPDGSSYWNTTAIIVTWDDWGGWYDHEPPPIEAYPQGGYQMGFRVPLIVVSAYTPAGSVSNLQEDFGSVLRFIESNFGFIEGALGFADLRGSGDLMEFFNLGQKPRPFQPIAAPLSVQYFLNTKPSGLPPDND
jgi:phospholipase C